MSKTESLASFAAAAAADAVRLYFEPFRHFLPSAAKPDPAERSPETRRRTRTPIGSLIGTGSEVSGDIYSAGRGLRIDGVVNGNVTCNNVLLVISEGATVLGDVRASYLILAGTVNGDIEATELVEVQPTATVNGNVVSPSVEVHPGAKIAGTLTTSSNVDLAKLRRAQFWARAEAQMLPELKRKA